MPSFYNAIKADSAQMQWLEDASSCCNEKNAKMLKANAETAQRVDALTEEQFRREAAWAAEIRTLGGENVRLKREPGELRLQNENLQRKDQAHQEQSRKWRKPYEDFFEKVRKIHHEKGLQNKATKALAASRKIVDEKRQSI